MACLLAVAVEETRRLKIANFSHSLNSLTLSFTHSLTIYVIQKNFPQQHFSVEDILMKIFLLLLQLSISLNFR